MRTLFFVSSMHAGGAERVAATLANGWVRRGDSITLVPTYTRKGECFYTLDPDVHLVWLADRMSQVGRKLWPPLSKRSAIRKLVRETRPDVIVSFLTNVNVVVLLSTMGLGVPVIVCERTNPAHSSSAGPLLQGLRRLTYPWASRVVLQSHDSVPAFKRLVPGLEHVDVVPNPLPPDVPDPEPAVRGGAASSGRKHMMAMGRLVSFKRFDALIRAFGALASDHPDWDLTIWGEGPLRGALMQQVRDMGLEGRVALPGRSSQPWSELRKAELFAMTSQVEGFPNVLLEAMALGRACVTVDCPSGPREMSRDGRDAILVPLGDQAALITALTGLMNDTARRDALGARAAASVRERYGLASILSQWDTLLQAAMTQKPQGGKA